MEINDYFEVMSSRSIVLSDRCKNLFFDLIEHKVQFPTSNAKSTEFYTVEHKFFACSAVCLDHCNNILLGRIPRFPLRDVPGDEFSWELPGGRSKDGETPIECINRELQEETGLVAESLEPVLKDYYYPECSFGTEKLYLYFARNAQFKGGKRPELEGEYELRWFPFAEALRMVYTCEIRSSWTIIGILATKLIIEGIVDKS